VITLNGLVGAMVEPSGDRPSLPEGGAGVQVGNAVEDRPDFVWMGWDEWVQNYPQLADQRAKT
jgi:hypothetical protein